MRIYYLGVTIKEGNDEFWEDVNKSGAKKKMIAEIQSCLADHGFHEPDTRVSMITVLDSEK